MWKIHMEEVLEDASEDWKWVFEVPGSETHTLGAGNLLAVRVPVFNTAFFYSCRRIAVLLVVRLEAKFDRFIIELFSEFKDMA